MIGFEFDLFFLKKKNVKNKISNAITCIGEQIQ